MSTRACRWVPATVLVAASVASCGGDGDPASSANGGGGGVGASDSAGSLCGHEVADGLTQVLANEGFGTYGFTPGASDGSGCDFDMTENGERASSRSLQIVMTDAGAAAGEEECSWGYQMDSDSYSRCPEFEVYWTFYTSEFRGNSNRLSETETLLIHDGFWKVIGDALAHGLEPSDPQATAERPEAEGAAPAPQAERDEDGCLTAEEVSATAQTGVTAQGGSPEEGCTYALQEYPGSVVTIVERPTGVQYAEDETWEQWYGAWQQELADWAAEVGASGLYGPVAASDTQYVDWQSASGGSAQGHDGTFVGVLVSYGDAGEWQREHSVIVDAMTSELEFVHYVEQDS